VPVDAAGGKREGVDVGVARLRRLGRQDPRASVGGDPATGSLRNSASEIVSGRFTSPHCSTTVRFAAARALRSPGAPAAGAPCGRRRARAAELRLRRGARSAQRANARGNRHRRGGAEVPAQPRPLPVGLRERASRRAPCRAASSRSRPRVSPPGSRTPSAASTCGSSRSTAVATQYAVVALYVLPRV
jgi:hypothetical protein